MGRPPSSGRDNFDGRIVDDFAHEGVKFIHVLVGQGTHIERRERIAQNHVLAETTLDDGGHHGRPQRRNRARAIGLAALERAGKSGRRWQPWPCAVTRAWVRNAWPKGTRLNPRRPAYVEIGAFTTAWKFAALFRETHFPDLPDLFQHLWGHQLRPSWPSVAAGRDNPAALHFGYSRLRVFSEVGKLVGTFCFTLPVAAHSAPRCSVVAAPTHFKASTLWPSVVCNTRPWP